MLPPVRRLLEELRKYITVQACLRWFAVAAMNVSAIYICRKNSVRMPVMHSLPIGRLALSISALLCTLVSAQDKPSFTSPLPTGVRLDPAGESVDLGSLPINLVLAPEAEKAVVVLSGWREQGSSGRRSEDAKGYADAAPGWRVLRRRLLARRPSPLRLRRQHRLALRLRMERWRRHTREQVRTGEGKNCGWHGHKLSGGTDVLTQRKIRLCRRKRRRSSGGGEYRDRRDHATVFYRSLSLWRRAHGERSSVRVGLGRQHGVAVPCFGGRNARVSRPDRGRPTSIGAGGEWNEAVRHARR